MDVEKEEKTTPELIAKNLKKEELKKLESANKKYW